MFSLDKLNAHLGSKKSEIEGLEGELCTLKTALEDKDKIYSKLLAKLNVQSSIYTILFNCTFS